MLDKLISKSTLLGDMCEELIFGVVITKNKDEVVSTQKKSGWKPFVEGKDIGAYRIEEIHQYLNYEPKLLHRARTKEIFEAKEKLLIQRITGGNKPIKVAYDNNQLYNKESINNLILKEDTPFKIKYILGLLNSNLVNWFYTNQFTNQSTLTVNLSKEYLVQIPIANLNDKQQDKIVQIVDKVLEMKKSNKDSSSLEKQINEMIYKLYDLTEEEIKIVQGS
ncbi:MAG: hypothetical protein A3K10_00935 [Bacteroidetes bacterium RIFCSPLOWO2_12_FULL_31_6]|nr:MAG: hypothetical protein A3K10_00935 [Bacteroidetes bacterium RIFCSPLOWO2_12_FULL_31_6]